MSIARQYGLILPTAPRAKAQALRAAETKVASIVSGETKVSGKLGGPSKGKPWVAAGMSKAAWYRRQKASSGPSPITAQ